MDGAERDQAGEVSGTSGSGSPKRHEAGNSRDDEAAGPSGRGNTGGRSAGGGGGGGVEGAGEGGSADPADERVRRRREINRNSQKRIRERRNKELDELRLEAQRLSSENEALLRQVETLTLARAEVLRQVQDLTDKWQQSIAENAWLNRENMQLRNAVQQLNALAGPGGGAAVALPRASPGGDQRGVPSLTPASAVLPPSRAPLHNNAGSLQLLGRSASGAGSSGGGGGTGQSAVASQLPGLPSCLTVPIGGMAGSAGTGLGLSGPSLSSELMATPPSLGGARAQLSGLPALMSLGAQLPGHAPQQPSALDRAGGPAPPGDTRGTQEHKPDHA